MPKTYVAMREHYRDGDRVVAFVIDEEDRLTPLVHRVLHSPDGFEIGYAGSGPADLARSICWDLLGREPHPIAYQTVKDAFLSHRRDQVVVREDQLRRAMEVAVEATGSADSRLGRNGELLSWNEAEDQASGRTTH